MRWKVIASEIDQFFFQKIDILQFALLRICLGFLVTLYLIDLLPYASIHFSQQGWLSINDLGIYNAGGWSLLFVNENDQYAALFFQAAIVLSISFTLGFLTKISGWATLIALVSLWNKNPLIMDGDDAVLRIMLFFLLLSPCGKALSIDQRIGRRQLQAEIWPLRMIQIQLAIIYFISGWVKFHSDEWLNGTILGYVLAHPDYSRWNLAPLLISPFIQNVLHVLAFIIRWWELLFPLLILQSKSRMISLTIGIAFHIGLLVFMNLRLFSWIMLSLYIAFIPSRYFRSWRT